MQKYKHTSGLIAIPFSESVWQIQGTAFYVPFDLFVNSKDWTEVETKSYPIGTVIRHIQFNVKIEKVGTAPQWRAETGTSFFDFDESLIGSVYELVSTPKEKGKEEFTILAFKHLLYPSNPREILYADSQLKNTFCKVNGKQPFFTLGWCLQTGFPIHSIRRESDGKVFTIGQPCNNTLITEIYMYSDQPFIRTIYGGYNFKYII